jgi:hypothetical protein
MNSDITRKLQSYTALALPIIAVAKISNAQIIHLDINPNVILNQSGQSFLLDLNGDHINDFEFKVNRFTQHTYHISKWSGSILASALGKNFIAGKGSSSTFLPFALDSGVRIGESLQWNPGNLQYLIGFYINGVDATSFSFGSWAPSAYKFIGLRFQDKDSVYHYGWLRAQTYRSGDSIAITLKDFAYESPGDSSIAAGDTGLAVSGLPAIADNQQIKINYFNHEVYITSQQNSIGAMIIEAFDIEGRRLLEYVTSQKQFHFSTATLPAGLFVVRVTQEGKTFAKKILLP